MTRPSSAAVPGRGRRDIAPTVLREHPGEEKPMGCPACRHPESLEYIVAAKHYNEIEAVEITEGSITYPVVTTVGPDSSDPQVDADDKPIGVRCTYCHWSYIGPNPSTRLVRV